MKEIELPEKLYIEDKIATNGYYCTDYYNYREQVAYTPEIKTRSDERNRLIQEIEEYIKMPRLNYNDITITDILDKLNSLK